MYQCKTCNRISVDEKAISKHKKVCCKKKPVGGGGNSDEIESGDDIHHI